MPIITQIVCDGCQAVKKEVNHWYAMTVTEMGAHLQPLDLLHDRLDAPLLKDRMFLCGRSCALTALTHWMDGLLVPPPVSHPDTNRANGGRENQSQPLTEQLFSSIRP